jgi:hypothetical protein
MANVRTALLTALSGDDPDAAMVYKRATGAYENALSYAHAVARRKAA